MTLDTDRQELATLFKSTFTRYDYKTAKAGIIKIPKVGKVTISLHNIQKGIKRDKNGKLKASEVFPDVHYLTLIPTPMQATSQSIDILNHFKGTSIFMEITLKVGKVMTVKTIWFTSA